MAVVVDVGVDIGDLAFELISILLLIALVGSIVLARRKKINKEDS